MENNNNEQKLLNLGLSAKQIDMVLNRLSAENVQLFINEFNKEKSQLSRNNISVSRNNIFQTDNFYKPRIIPNFSERMSAKDMNKQYEEKSKFRNDPTESLDILSMQLFGDSNLYNDQYLGTKYRQLALQFHPDRNNGDNSQFNMLKNCYNHLKQKLYNENSVKVTYNKSNRTFDDSKNIVPPPNSLFDNKFDNQLFNKYYSDNSFKTNNKGYGEWLKQNDSQIEKPTRPTENNFNNVFDDHKKQHYNATNNNQLMRIQEIPDENPIATDAYLLGEDESKTSDFSGQTKSGIKYSDLRRALETPHLIYNEPSVKENNICKDYTNMKQNNQNIPSKMTDTETEIYNRNLSKKREIEESRIYTLQQQDEDIGNHFEKINHNRLTL